MFDSKKMGERIKRFRKQSGFTQESVAHFLNVDQTLISKVENGERTLSVELTEKLAYLFGVDTSALEGDDTPVTSITFAFRANELSNEDMEAISAINRIALNSKWMAKMLAGGNADA